MEDGLIPSYDALADKHCTYTRTRAFKSSPFGNLINSTEVSAELSRDASKGAPGSPLYSSSMKRPMLPNKNTLPAFPSTLPSSGPVVEMNVYKSILIRESLIGRVTTIVRSLKRLDPNDTKAESVLLRGRSKLLTSSITNIVDHQIGLAPLLDHLRVATTETVEAIVRWRRGGGYHQNDYALKSKGTKISRDPFMYNGLNYLLQMTADLDFLHNVQALRRAVPFR